MMFAVLMWEEEPHLLWQVEHPDSQREFNEEWEDCCKALDAKEGGRVWDLPQILATMRCRGWQIKDAGTWAVVEG